MKRKSPLSFYCLLSIITVAGLACGSKKSPVDKGIEDQILHIQIGSDPSSLDLHIFEEEPASTVISEITEGLFNYDPKDSSPSPGLAERWERSEDGLVYTFTLRKTQWSNGDPLTAHDFVYSWKRLMSPELGSTNGDFLDCIENADKFRKGEITNFDLVGVRAADDQTLQVKLSKPVQHFIKLLQYNPARPVHPATIEKHGGAGNRESRWTDPENFVGIGPFLPKKRVSHSYIHAVKNPSYWDAANVKLNEVYFYVSDNAQTYDRMYRAGEVHVSFRLPPTRTEHYIKSKEPDLVISQTLSLDYYEFNTRQKPLDDKRVRQALSLAINRTSLTTEVLRSGDKLSSGYVPSRIADYTTLYAQDIHDLAKAQSLLAEAGYPGGQGFPSLTLSYNTNTIHKTVAEFVQQQWKSNLNIDVSITSSEFKVHLSNKRKKEFDIARSGWRADFADAINFFGVWTSWSGFNNSSWSSAEFDSLYNQAFGEADVAKRNAFFQRMESILFEESVAIPLFSQIEARLVHPAVRGYFSNDLNYHPLKYVSLAK